MDGKGGLAAFPAYAEPAQQSRTEGRATALPFAFFIGRDRSGFISAFRVLMGTSLLAFAREPYTGSVKPTVMERGCAHAHRFRQR